MEGQHIQPERIKEAGKPFLIAIILSTLFGGTLAYLNFNTSIKTKEDLESLLFTQKVISVIFGLLIVGALVNGCIELMRCTKKHK